MAIRCHPGGPQVGHRLLPVVHARQTRCIHALHNPRQATGSGFRRSPGRPERLPTFQGSAVGAREAAEGTRGGQCLESGPVEPDAACQVVGAGVRPTGHDLLGQVVADAAHRRQSEPHRRASPPPRSGRASSRCCPVSTPAPCPRPSPPAPRSVPQPWPYPKWRTQNDGGRVGGRVGVGSGSGVGVGLGFEGGVPTGCVEVRGPAPPPRGDGRPAPTTAVSRSPSVVPSARRRRRRPGSGNFSQEDE